MFKNKKKFETFKVTERGSFQLAPPANGEARRPGVESSGARVEPRRAALVRRAVGIFEIVRCRPCESALPCIVCACVCTLPSGIKFS